MTIGSPIQWSCDLEVSQVDQLNGQCSPFYFQGQRAIKYPSSSIKKATYNPIVSETGKRKFALIVEKLLLYIFADFTCTFVILSNKYFC